MTEPHTRITKDELLMRCAWAAVDRSEDPHLRVGAAIMTEAGRIYGVSYNGLPPGKTLPPEIMQDRERKRPYMLHAERNIARLANLLVPHTVAVTVSPCGGCITSLECEGVKRILYATVYDREGLAQAQEVCDFFGISLEHYPMLDPFHTWPKEAVAFVHQYSRLHDFVSRVVEDPERVPENGNGQLIFTGYERRQLADILQECEFVHNDVPKHIQLPC